MKIGFLGLGKMGQAILNGILSTNIYMISEIYAYDKFIDDKEKYEAKKVLFLENELDLYSKSDIFFMCVKPQSFTEIYEILKNATNKPKVIVSIAAGISINNISTNLNVNNVIRVMPNLACSINMGVTTISKTASVTDDIFMLVQNIFNSIGISYEVEEEEINSLLPLNGSFPAYLYEYVNGFIKACSNNGIDEMRAREIILQTTIGSCLLALKDLRPLDNLISDICSKKGTTIEGIDVLRKNELDETTGECYQACFKRAEELTN